MVYLVDANVLSEATKPEPDTKVMAWLSEHLHEIVVDPIIVGEIRFGIHLKPAGKRRRALELWFADGVEKLRCLPWDVETGLRWAELLADLRAAGASMPIKDSLIAATALVHGLRVVTRNGKDFEKAGVRVVNPWKT
ncbi:MAG: type II toxin-antitoxin system VapC family toxin [Phycisphaerales bacterium]|nr:type II toxin-antitoxin system VapC family toxin [Phycisphaerales bacterium]